jgi:hypothetical protein
VPFDEIARIVDRSPDAARQLASRARRHVQAENPFPDADLNAQREVVDTFRAAARDGNFGPRAPPPGRPHDPRRLTALVGGAVTAFAVG